MSGSRARGKAARPDPATEAYAAGLVLVKQNPAFAALEVEFCRNKHCRLCPEEGLTAVDSNGHVHAHPTRRAEPAEWAWALAHSLLHLGFGHVPAAEQDGRAQPDPHERAARCTVVNRFLSTFPAGRAPTTSPPHTPGATRNC